MKVTAKTTTGDIKKSVTCEVVLPDALAEKIKHFGEAVVNSASQDSLVISAQALMRRMISKGKTDKEIQDALTAWKPDVKSVIRQSAFEKAAKSVESMSDTERAELLKKLQGLAKPTATHAAGAGAHK